jgi:hypothetical protein
MEKTAKLQESEPQTQAFTKPYPDPEAEEQEKNGIQEEEPVELTAD